MTADRETALMMRETSKPIVRREGKKVSERVEAAANAISEASGMRFDGFWSRIEDLEPEDREYALAEAKAALEAADAVTLSDANVERVARAWAGTTWPHYTTMVRSVLTAALKGDLR